LKHVLFILSWLFNIGEELNGAICVVNTVRSFS